MLAKTGNIVIFQGRVIWFFLGLHREKVLYHAMINLPMDIHRIGVFFKRSALFKKRSITGRQFIKIMKEVPAHVKEISAMFIRHTLPADFRFFHQANLPPRIQIQQLRRRGQPRQASPYYNDIIA